MPFESRDGVQGKLVIRVNRLGGAGHDHGGDGLVAFQEVFHNRIRDCDEVRFEVFGILYEKRRVYNSG